MKLDKVVAVADLFFVCLFFGWFFFFFTFSRDICVLTGCLN